MLGSLASYIFGAEEGTDRRGSQVPEDRTLPTLSDEDDWVVVSGNAQPSLTLGSLNEAVARPPTGSSFCISEVVTGDDAAQDHQPHCHQVQPLRSGRRQVTQFGSCSSNDLVSQVKVTRCAQKNEQRERGKSLASKAMDRKNKAVKNNQSRMKKKGHFSISMRAAGCNKQLKMC